MKATLRRFSQDSKYVTILGFGLVLALLIAVTGIGLSRMHMTNQRMEAIVRDHNVKTDLVTNLRTVARERILSIHKLLLMEDAFEIDAEVQHFIQLAGEFIRYRDELLQQKLTPLENATLAAAMPKVRASSPLQDEVVHWFLQGNTPAAQRILKKQVMPAQEDVFIRFNELLNLQHESTRRDMDSAEREYLGAIRMMGILGLTAFVVGIGIMMRVVRRIVRYESALFQEKERAQVTLHSIGDAVIATDATGHIDYLNPIAEQLTGWRAVEARGLPLAQVYALIDEKSRQRIELPSGPGQFDGWTVGLGRNALLINKNGAEFCIESSATPIRNHEGGTVGFVSVFHDVTAERRMAQQLTWQASHDPLTGLPNRREFERRLMELLNHTKQTGNHHILLYMDLDQFKLVNDTSGHGAGDELLRQLAAIMQPTIRDHDLLARLGGDEFGVLLEECTIPQGTVIAETLRQAIAEFRFVREGKTFEIGVSIGLVAVAAHTENMAALLSAADSACYMAKEKGRNRIWIHQKDDAELLQRRGEMQWVTRITRAFEENRFRLYYQNIVAMNAHPQDRIHCEILLRLEDESGQIVSPMMFIPAAERYGLMPAIDRWVIRTMFDWLLNHPGSTDECCYAINISGQSLGDDQFLAYVVDQFHNSEVNPRAICFEITETSAIANLSRAMRFINTLKGMGCRFSLDDFGSGMSSFTYLKNLSVDSIKIDGAFVRDMVTDQVDFVMVEAINRIGHAMGIRTVGEFVENEAILDQLRKLGVDYAQGYAIHQPAPLHFLSSNRSVAVKQSA